jgi:hypothetical protein
MNNNDDDRDGDRDVWPDDDAQPPAATAPRPRWPAIVAALVIGALAGAVGFALQQTLERTERADVVARAPAAAGSVPTPQEADIARLLHVEPPQDLASAPLPADQMRVCGEVVPRSALADDRIDRTLADVGAGAAIERFAQERLNDDEHARAVALVLRMQVDADYREGPDAARDCRSDECWKRAARAHAERVAPLRDRLATLAAASSDARVVYLARDQCQALTVDAPASPHCQALTARRLVALDRDNAAAWIALAVEEPTAVDEALYQASIAARWDDYALAARRFIERIDAQGGLRSLALTQALLSVPGSRAVDSLQLVLDRCSVRRLADANLRQQCEQLATTLLERSRNLMLHGTGVTLATTLGRDDAAPRSELAQLLSFVLSESEHDEAQREALDASCGLGLPRDLLARSARDGELAAAREMLQRSPTPESQWRERMLAARQAQQAEAAKRQAESPAERASDVTVAAAASAPR